MASNKKQYVVGLYGIPGSGKSYLKRQLETALKLEPFVFYEGSEKLAEVCPRGLDEFKRMNKSEQDIFRSKAIRMIRDECAAEGKAGVVVGHFMFWDDEAEGPGASVCTEADMEVFTHIIYLEVDPQTVHSQILGDEGRSDRESLSVDQLWQWQDCEMLQLRARCYQHQILYATIKDGKSTVLDQAVKLLRNFRIQNEEENLAQAVAKLYEIIGEGSEELNTILMIDADRTLAAVDTGKMFWDHAATSLEQSCLKNLFGMMEYSYTAFRRAAVLYEEFGDDDAFESRCQQVADKIQLYPEFSHLLKWVTNQKHIRAVIVTSGLSNVWTKVLEREGLSKAVKVIGGGRLSDRFVVTPEVKGELVARLQQEKKMYVWAFGDSPVDKYMLLQADQAVVVVGEKDSRSRSMEGVLEDLIDNRGFRARQLLLPHGVTTFHRLDTTKLPVVEWTELFEGEIKKSKSVSLKLEDATNNPASKLLSRDMRDSSIGGPALREAHRRAGQYLATVFVTNIIGLEGVEIQHVQERTTTGYRLLHEKRTSIVACMRGGEPMAFGVNDVFPLARFYHAENAESVKKDWLEGQSTVLLVDSVINNGDTIVEFVTQIRKLHGSIRILVLAGVVQDQAVAEDGQISKNLHGLGKLTIVALRLSKTKFTGSGTTDTGNRLFNTTYKTK